MRVILYANVSANGRVLLSENQRHQVPAAVIEASADDIRKAKNLIMGRKSFENFERAFGGLEPLQAAFPEVVFVWFSRTAQQAPGRLMASTPEEAIAQLKARGHNDVIVGGGPETYQAFLDSGLITDVVLNVVPVVAPGGDLGAGGELDIPLILVGQRLLTEHVVQLHYRKA